VTGGYTLLRVTPSQWNAQTISVERACDGVTVISCGFTASKREFSVCPLLSLYWLAKE